MPAQPRRTQRLTIRRLCAAAKAFAIEESLHAEPLLYGVTDGKAVGTYLEQKFREQLAQQFSFAPGNSAEGVDFPELGVDVKVTSIRQPQSSCPFRSARQKVFGLEYSLLVFVYEKVDDSINRTSTLHIRHTVLIDQSRTADFQTTSGIRRILENQGNKEDLLAFFQERMLPLDDLGASQLADDVLANPPELGYPTISNALQWRLQYGRAIVQAGEVNGIKKVM